MPRTVFDEEFIDGQLVKRTPRIISDADLVIYDAPDRIKQIYAIFRQWQIDADNVAAGWDLALPTQKDAALKLTIQRFGKLCDRMADMILLIGHADI